MSGDGRTVWWPKDAAWWRREHVVELGEEFGPAGPVVLDWLSCEAKSQNDGGWVKAGVRSCARGCFVEPVTVSHVLSRAVAIGALDEMEQADGRFRCRISGWAADNTRGGAAMRKQAQREKEAASHGESRPVTDGHLKGQERSNEGANAPSSPPAEFSDDVIRLCDLHSQLVRQRTEEKEGSRRSLPTRSWYVEMDRLIRLDRRSPREIERAIRWVHADPFWSGIVLSVPKLREKYGQLVAAARAGRNAAPSQGAAGVDDLIEQMRRRGERQADGDVIEGSEAAA